METPIGKNETYYYNYNPMDVYEKGMVAGAIITVENLREKHLISDKVADALIKAAKEFHFSSVEEKKLGKEYWGGNK